jgi:hypothetical protein
MSYVCTDVCIVCMYACMADITRLSRKGVRIDLTLFLCMHMHIHIYIHMCVCTYIYIYIYTHTHIHTLTYTHTLYCSLSFPLIFV